MEKDYTKPEAFREPLEVEKQELPTINKPEVNESINMRILDASGLPIQPKEIRDLITSLGVELGKTSISDRPSGTIICSDEMAPHIHHRLMDMGLSHSTDEIYPHIDIASLRPESERGIMINGMGLEDIHYIQNAPGMAFYDPMKNDDVREQAIENMRELQHLMLTEETKKKSSRIIVIGDSHIGVIGGPGHGALRTAIEAVTNKRISDKISEDMENVLLISESPLLNNIGLFQLNGDWYCDKVKKKKSERELASERTLDRFRATVPYFAMEYDNIFRGKWSGKPAPKVKNIKAEFELIKQKKSKLSRSDRDWVEWKFNTMYDKLTPEEIEINKIKVGGPYNDYC